MAGMKKKRGRPPKKKKPEGLGDVVEQITEKTGIKKAVEWIAGKDCGCEERKQKLNEMFPKKPECLLEHEYNYLTEYFERHNEKKFTSKDVYDLMKIHHRVLKFRPHVCMNCNSGVKVMNDVVSNLKKLYEQY